MTQKWLVPKCPL